MFETLFPIVDKLYNKYFIWKRKIVVGKGLFIQGKCFIAGEVIIGDNVRINSGWVFNPIGGQERTIIYTRGEGCIKIGNNVGMSNVAIVARKSISIQDDVWIGGNCKIYDNDFHPLNYTKRMEDDDEYINAESIEIKKGAFIGAHSIILKGVTIGERSVIGAGSVVTKNVPDREIWAGNPAKFIRVITE